MRILLSILLTLQVCCVQLSLSQGRDYSIIIAVDQIDVDAYNAHKLKTYPMTQGNSGDVVNLRSIANMNKHRTIVLQNQDATVSAILNTLRNVSTQADKDATVFIYFLGYGDEVPDKSNEESTGYDQAFLAYDSLLLDDSLYAILNDHFTNKLCLLFTDLRHAKSLSLPDHYFVDFKSATNEARAFNETLSVQPCDLLIPDVVDEKFNLIYFGMMEGLTGQTSLANQFLVKYNSARITGRARTLTGRQLACLLTESILLQKGKLIYYEIGTTISNYSNQPIFN